MQTFLINLDRSPDRLAHMLRQFSILGLEAERVQAVDGRGAVPEQLMSQFVTSRLTSGEVGCYASHLLVMEMMRARNLPYAVILEDDGDLHPDFAKAAAEAVVGAPDGWDVVHLCTTFKKNRVYPVAQLPSGREIIRYTRRPLSALAYIISAEGCRKFLRPRARVRPVDQEFRQSWHIGLGVLGLRPAIAQGCTRLGTTIGQPAGKRHWGPRTPSEFIAKARYVWASSFVG